MDAETAQDTVKRSQVKCHGKRRAQKKKQMADFETIWNAKIKILILNVGGGTL